MAAHQEQWPPLDRYSDYRVMKLWLPGSQGEIPPDITRGFYGGGGEQLISSVVSCMMGLRGLCSKER